MASDEALLEALLCGNIHGFDLLYQRYERPLFSYIRRYHPQQADAEDVLHETFLALLRDRAAAERVTSLRAWLFQVARNLCLNRHRSLRRARQALADHPEPPALALPPLHPESRLEHAQGHQSLLAAVANLPVELAELFQMRSSGLSYEEMASVLGVPLGTVKSRIHTMVNRLGEEVQRDL